MAFSTFRTWGEKIFSRFPRMRREWEGRLIYGIGYTADQLYELANFALASRFVAVAPDDALPYHGRDRRLIRGPAEAAGAFRRRLQAAWTAWSKAGSEEGLLAQVNAYLGTTGSFVIESQDADQPPRSLWWSRFWLVIPQGSHSYSGSVPADDQTALTRIVNQFRPAHVICDNVTVVESGYIWHPWPTGLDWDGSVDWGDSVVHQWDVQGDPT